MNPLNSRTARLVFSFVLWFAAVLAVGLALNQTWSYYANVCPTTDILSWDGNLRFNSIIDQYQDFKQGHIFSGIGGVLDSPVWPPFRAILSLLTFAVSPSGPSVHLEVSLTFVFWLLLFPSLLYVSVRMSGSFLRGVLIFWALSALLIYSRELPKFSVSAMVEVQGMFFSLWSFYFIHRLFSLPEGRGPDTPLLLGLFFSIQGVTFTKYPYGVMLLLALAMALVLQEPGKYLGLMKKVYREHYKGWRIFATLFFMVVIVYYMKSGKMGDGVPSGTRKFAKTAVYLSLLILLVDLGIFFFRRRADLWPGFPREFRALVLMGYLPTLVWIFMHPTRVNTVLGTQQREIQQDGGKSYTSFFFSEVFDDKLIPLLLVLGALLLLVLFLNQSRKGGSFSRENIHYWLLNQKTEKPRFRNLLGVRSLYNINNPLLVVSLLILIQILILEFTTVNKQQRHLYHLIPALLLMLSLWTLRLTAMFPRAAGPLLAGLALLSGILLHSGPNRVFGGNYTESRPLCYNGRLPELLNPARDLAESLKPDKKYILINLFHKPEILDLHRPIMATPVDFYTRMHVLKQGDLRNDSRYRYKSWGEFDSLLVAGIKCGNPLAKKLLEKRKKETSSRLKFIKRRSRRFRKLPGELFKGKTISYCLEEYKILK